MSFFKSNQNTIFSILIIFLILIIIPLDQRANADGIFGDKEYKVGDTIHLKLVQLEYNADYSLDSVLVHISSDSLPEGRDVFLEETAPDSGIFEWNLILGGSPGDLVKAEFFLPSGLKLIHSTIISDEDGTHYLEDNCPHVWNKYQEDRDEDGIGDHCDDFPDDKLNDVDEDGIGGSSDNCPETFNPKQDDSDKDREGDACDSDDDNDSVDDSVDNCSLVPNQEQEDRDEDGIGDACDETNDFDKDGIVDKLDNCTRKSNPNQEDFDLDGIGNVCDEYPRDPKNDEDGDKLGANEDNCPKNWNIDQSDLDGDRIGDVCDETPEPTDWLAIGGIVAGIVTAVVLFFVGIKRTGKKPKDIPSPKDSKLK